MTISEPMHPDFKHILDNFIKQYGKKKGTELFYKWVNKHNLDDTKPYRNADQLQECTGELCESFRWVDEPLIQFYKKDDEATLWKVVALTANLSMNRNDYTDVETFKNTAASLSWRPLDWNHDHSLMLPFPDARTELAVFEDNAVETIIRIPNDLMHYEKPVLVNDMIRNGDILHVSIEGTPRGGKITSKGVAPQHWNFTGLALLEKDVTLPGDPLTYIEPLFLNESMGRSLVESLMEEGRNREHMTEDYEEGTEELGEAVWTRAYINDLPDSSFAYIEPGGRKDDEGKTVPRSLRHLPYKDAEGNIDKAHVRNALARLPQTDIPAHAKAAARRKLVAAAKKVGVDVQELAEDYDGVGGITTCGQCRYFTDLKDTTQEIPHLTGVPPDSSTITRTSGGLGAGVGICQVATRLTGGTVYVRKNDPACTDGRPRTAPTDADRVKERKNLEEIEKEALKNTYESRLAAKEKQLYEETQKTNKEREEKLQALVKIREHNNELREKSREIAKLTNEVANLKEERMRYREEIDNLNEQVAMLNIGITERDKDIKHYKDRYDAYERTHRDLTNETIMLKEQMRTIQGRRDEEAEKRAEANQRALNAEQARARLAEENAILIEKLASLQQEVYDVTRVRADSAKQLIENTKKMQELREKIEEQTRTIRDLKQKLAKRPRKIRVKG